MANRGECQKKIIRFKINNIVFHKCECTLLETTGLAVTVHLLPIEEYAYDFMICHTTHQTSYYMDSSEATELTTQKQKLLLI
jgi:hypothetical protein